MSMHARTLLAWIAVGLLGLALAAGVTYAATQLSSQRIGLSAEPPSAGEELAPPGHPHGPARTATTPPPPPQAGPTRAGRKDDPKAGGHRSSPGERREGHRPRDLDD